MPRRPVPAPSRRPHRLSRAQELAVYAALGALTVTGGGWLLLHNFVQTEGPFGPGPSPFERPLMVAHGLISIVFLVLAGVILEAHVRRAWAFKVNRTSGLLLLGLLGVAVVTAGGLYYLAGEGLRAAASLAHWTLGVAAATVLGVHAAARKAGRDGDG